MFVIIWTSVSEIEVPLAIMRCTTTNTKVYRRALKSAHQSPTPLFKNEVCVQLHTTNHSVKKFIVILFHDLTKVSLQPLVLEKRQNKIFLWIIRQLFVNKWIPGCDVLLPITDYMFKHMLMKYGNQVYSYWYFTHSIKESIVRMNADLLFIYYIFSN